MLIHNQFLAKLSYTQGNNYTLAVVTSLPQLLILYDIISPVGKGREIKTANAPHIHDPAVLRIRLSSNVLMYCFHNSKSTKYYFA